ncbi:MAG TPA: cbb3-type cytochrome c oxidase subunit I [Candidatus Binataceae bacterium]|nr:cbb3-type cytochrome c oxidase subunit I [Candidatus Binataceae bacterium]
MSTAIVYQPDRPFALPANQRRLISLMLYLGFAALAVGVVNGLAQALNYADIDVFRYFPGLHTYYEGLTVHGVFNVIVLTFAFANGFVSLTTARGLNRPLNDGLLWAAFVTLLAGAALAAGAILSGHASVLYTFYAPLEAHWTFYLGLTLIVVSTWLTSANLFLSLSRWRREHRGERIPLLAYISVVTFIFWDIASVGVAADVVFMLLPWSLGILSGVDPMLSRTLFWFTGHPIVYFWLLPVYVSWYAMIPRQVSGSLFSDTAVRLVFLMFLVIIPIGLHHQYVDPGISPGLKFVVAALTFVVFLPSLLTAFSVMYALEIGGRRRGGSGLIGWFFRLPWGEPSVAAQVLAMLAFMLGGITGLINASYSLNLDIHNTAFVPGHFHLTIGSAVALSYMGITYWLVPYLEQKKLWGKRIALAQAWCYFVGVLIFARGLISGGLAGMPRRTAISLIDYPMPPGWREAGILTGVGGTLMFIGAALFFVVLAMTVLFGERTEIADIPFTDTIEPPPESGWLVNLDRFRYWVAATIVLCVLIYGPLIYHHLPPQLYSSGSTNY